MCFSYEDGIGGSNSCQKPSCSLWLLAASHGWDGDQCCYRIKAKNLMISFDWTLMYEDRSKAASSMESFSATDELACLEGRLKMKLVASGFLRFVNWNYLQQFILGNFNLMVVVVCFTHWEHWGAKPVATPARTTAPAPSVPPRRKPECGSTVVKTENAPVVLPPPCTSFTPVKSPNQKKAKPDAPSSVADPSQLKRSLCCEMEAADNANEGPMEPTQLDSTLEKSAEKPVPWFQTIEDALFYLQTFISVSYMYPLYIIL